MHDILYKLEAKRYDKGTILQVPGNKASKLYFIQTGVLDVY
jgi:CRP-like cAMP-binding protein